MIVCMGILAAITVSCGQAKNSHMKRGSEWMELKRFQEARQEFTQVITEEPKNAEARYEIARSYQLERNFVEAIQWADDCLKVDKTATAPKGLIKQVTDETYSMLQTDQPNANGAGIASLVALLKSGYISPQDPAITKALAPLLGSADERIAEETLTLLVSINGDSAALLRLAQSKDSSMRIRAFELIRNHFGEKYAPALREILSDSSENLRHDVARLLVEKLHDEKAKTVLAGIYHAWLQNEIAIGRTAKDTGIEFSDKISEVASVGPGLGEPSLAGELAELLFVGRVYGFLDRPIRSAVSEMGEPARPYVAKKLEHVSEYRSLLQARGFDSSRIDWRFQGWDR